MNRVVSHEFHRLSRAPQDLRQGYESTLYGILWILWRRKVLILFLAAVTLFAAGATYMALGKQYDAEALIQLKFGEERLGGSSTSQAASLALDAAALVESEAEIIRSHAIARRVVNQLDLADDSAFAQHPSLFSRLTGIAGGLGGLGFASRKRVATTGDEDEPTNVSDQLILAIQSGLSVRNNISSYLIKIGYTSDDAERSATIANAFANEYLRSRIEASYEAATRTGEWLGTQVEAARVTLAQAEDDVRNLRQQSVVESSAEGSQISEQQLRDLTAQLSVIKLQRLEQETRLSRVREIIASGNTPSLGDLGGSASAQQLIEEEMAAKREVGRIEATLGVRHPFYGRAEVALEDVQSRLAESLGGTIGLLETSVESALASEERLTEQVSEAQKSALAFQVLDAGLKQSQAASDAARVQLRNLEESYRQASALADLKPIPAQLVSPAEAIAIPSFPRPEIILALAVLAGALATAILIFLLERRDTGFRTASEAISELDAPCMGMIPARPLGLKEGERSVHRQAVRSLAITSGLIEPKAECALVVITSSVPDEGKTELAMVLANVLAKAGQRVLVLAQGLKPTSRTSVQRSPSDAYAVVSEQGITAENLLALSQGEPLCYYRGTKSPINEMFETNAGLQSWLDGVSEYFDVILVEAPPVTLFAESAVLARAADLVLYAVRWNSTPRKTVVPAFRHVASSPNQPIGIVLTQVNTAQHRKYRCLDSIYYYERYNKTIPS